MARPSAHSHLGLFIPDGREATIRPRPLFRTCCFDLFILPEGGEGPSNHQPRPLFHTCHFGIFIPGCSRCGSSPPACCMILVIYRVVMVWPAVYTFKALFPFPMKRHIWTQAINQHYKQASTQWDRKVPGKFATGACASPLRLELLKLLGKGA